MFEARLDQLQRSLQERPGDEDLWVEYACLLYRLGRFEELAASRPDAVLRDALWEKVAQDLTLVVAILPLFGLRVPVDVDRPPGRFWEGHYRLGRGDGFFYDRKTGFPLEVERIRDGGRMVLVPEGRIQHMSLDGSGREVLMRWTRTVSAYLADRCPVTVDQFRGFVESRGHPEPTHWETQLRRPRRPVVFVSRRCAEAYARWADARLLGTLGWEKAARGTHGSPVPWKSEGRVARHANLRDPEREEERAASDWDLFLEEVGSRPDGVSTFGVEDMAGNVLEWCGEQPEGPRYSHQDPPYMVSGSSWLDRADGPLLGNRSLGASTRRGDLGFRLGRPLSALVRTIDHLDLLR